MLTDRIHLALKAYHELLNCVAAMDQSDDAAVRSSAQIIKGFCSTLHVLSALGTEFEMLLAVSS